MNTKQITRGAMMCAIYGLLLFFNQQSGLTIETSANWLFAFPVLIFTCMYGNYAGGIVAIAMVLMTFLFGGFTTWFYSWSAILIGYLYGSGLFHKRSHMSNFLLTSILSIVSCALIIYLWAGIFGYDIHSDFKDILAFFPMIHLRVVVFLFVIVMGLMQALAIHLIALMICIRLKLEIEPLKPVTKMFPPRWFGIVSLGMCILYVLNQNMLHLSLDITDLIQVITIIDLLVLDYFGVLYFLNKVIQKSQRRLAFFAIFGAFIPIVNFIWVIAGLLDCLLGLRAQALDSRE